MGQAAIQVALSYGCTVYTTVGTEEKKQFLKKRFPQLEDHHFSNSRSTEFEYEIMKVELKSEGSFSLLHSCYYSFPISVTGRPRIFRKFA